jgi:hypothetical protein
LNGCCCLHFVFGIETLGNELAGSKMESDDGGGPRKEEASMIYIAQQGLGI